MSMLQVGLLGPVSVHVGSRPVPVTSARQAALLACLALHAPRLAPLPTIIAALWDTDPPRTAEQTVQQYVSALRTALEPDRTARAPSRLLITQGTGYRLAEFDLDVDEFDSAARRADLAAAAEQWPAALVHLDAALTCWRGPALAGLPGTPYFLSHQVRLTEQRVAVRESRLDALLAMGGFGQVIGESEVLLAEEPLREAIWARLIRALYRSGRSAEALAAYGRARRILREELGLEPGEALRTLERQVLEQDRALDAVSSGAVPAVEVSQTFRSDGAEGVPWLELPDGQMVALHDGSYIVGRQPGSGILLRDSRVSRSHAELECSAGRVGIRDLQSLNSTTVNGKRLGAKKLLPLTDGDLVSIGGVRLIFHTTWWPGRQT